MSTDDPSTSSSGDGEPVETAGIDARPASRAFLAFPERLGEWICDDVRLEDEQSLKARFRVASGQEWIEVTVTSGAPAAGVRVFHQFERCAVRYRGQLSAPSDERKAAVRAIVMGVGSAIDARLAEEPPGTTLAAALGRRAAAGPLVFSRASLRELLAPEIVEGATLAGGWTLADVYPTSYLRDAPEARIELVLDFQRASDGRRALFVVAPRSEDKPGFLRTAHFGVSHLSLGGGEIPGLEPLRALVGFVLQLRDDPAREVQFPSVLSDVDLARALGPGAEDESAALTAGDGPDESHRELNLAIQSECGQSCSFCSIKDTAPAEDGGERVLARLGADLSASRRRGVRRLRLNGYDPLTFSRVLDVLGLARELGYEHVDVFSPCTTLASREFADAVIDALPPSHTFHVPLYGVEPAVHDDVVGRPGAHALVLAAIEQIRRRSGPTAVQVLSVVTNRNAGQMPALAAWAEAQGFRFSAHLPYPSFESRADRFFRAAPRQTAVALAFVPSYLGATSPRALPILGLAPCVVHRVLGGAGVPLRRWLTVPERSKLPGTEYRDESFRHGAGERANAAFAASTVPCPHVERCVLRDACSRELFRSYVELHGQDEFQPVSLGELVAAG